ncbi:glycosylase [Rathayibacter sp. VKM Ac-2803]|uniref:glycoside hydrolase family 130 protein n=1 Tax=Rathayibacter sp. VKM Ac-2803 TaxID=2609256 RepID=UPI00135694E8|nr:glycosylase [Rathayibacter sp. VKM Ac-2803]MWV47869.1 glycosylase [Rathayibacter sp. VKM Ac-2803]
MTPGLRVHDATLDSDASRVLWQLYLPGSAPTETRSRVSEILERIRALTDAELADALRDVRAMSAARAADGETTLREHAAVEGVAADDPRVLVIGAAFTAEYALEGAALCNPSAMPHPDQSGLGEGQLRVALSVRQIGEGHRSSIGFASAVIGPGRTWAFDDRGGAPAAAEISPGTWTVAHLRAALGPNPGEVALAVLRALPETFTADDLDPVIAALPAPLTRRHDAPAAFAALRGTARSAYRASFPLGEALAQRTLIPSAAQESHGMEDARFTLDVSGEYRATYTAYDGSTISSRLLVSRDLQTFDTHQLTGEPAGNKGMALFPRAIGGVLYALSRTDGDTNTLARSEDGRHWDDIAELEPPRHLWDAVQRGNCGPPIETDRGWLVVTHGVGPLRRYSLGAMLLDLEDPRVVLASLTTPLLEPDGERQDGYVPNVVYSCGSVLHEGVVWIPFGIGDVRIGVASIEVDDLLDAMTPA